MSSEPAAHDEELRRWAARYGPSVLARAQAEAVAALRDALVEAALEQSQEASGRPTSTPRPQGRESTPRRQPRLRREGNGHPERAREPQSPDLLWAYCVLRPEEVHPVDLVGVDPRAEIERVQSGNLAVLVSRVPGAEFGAEPLRRNLNDLPWLERVARAHEAVLDAMLTDSTIVPLRLCTLYESEASVRQMLEQERTSFDQALVALHGKLEWALKVLVDWPTMTEAVQVGDDDARPAESGEERGEGSAYMLRRRSEQSVRNAATSMAAAVADEIHARVQDWAIDAITRPAQNRELSGYSGEMILNAAYLVERSRADELHGLVAELEDRHRHLGVTLDLTGPWPPYNFVPGGTLR